MIGVEETKLITATSAFIAAIVMGFKRAGLVTFGRPVERRACSKEFTKQCGDHKTMVADILTIKDNSAARLEKLNQMDVKIDSMATDIAKIIGYLQGRNGYHT